MGSEASEDEETDLETPPPQQEEASVSTEAALFAESPTPEAPAPEPVAVSPKRAHIEPRDSDGNGSFPTPFKCSGEFCGFLLVQEDASSAAARCAALSGSQLVAKYANWAASERLSPMQLLFSQDEQQALSADQWSALLGSKRLSFQSGAPNGDLRVIAYKSIALAKANKTHLAAAMRAAQGKKTTSTTGKHTQSSKGVDKDKERRRSSLLNSTASQELREGSRVRVYGELDGIANYYRQVRVCGDCYAFYMLLDRARQMMHERGSQPSYKSRRHQSMAVLHGGWDAMVDKEMQEKEKVFLRQQSTLQRKSEAGDLKTDPMAALGGSVSLPELSSVSYEGLEFSLPPLVSPTSKDSRDSLSGRRESSDTSLSSVTMPPLSISSTGSDPLGKPFSTLVTSATEPAKVQQMLRTNDSVSSMEKYLRGQSKQIEEQKLQEGQLFRSKTPRTTATTIGRKTTKTFASVLLIDSDTKNLDLLQQTLHAMPSLELTIESICDGSEALRVAKEYAYDLILCERDLASGINGLEFAKLLRHHQAQRKAASSSFAIKSLIICMSTKTSREDLQLYKDTGMDGCVGKPINPETLRHTVQAALAKLANASSKEAASGPQSSVNAVDAATEALARAKLNQQERRKRRKRRLEASSALPFPGIADMNADEDYMHGVFQMDGETSMPFCVMGECSNTPTATPNTFFNLVVIHDLFDTWERMQILLRPIITRYQGHIQVLVWNYPGQAYTTWRHGVVLNNRYHAQCFHELLQYTRSQGLLRAAPYYLMGVGNGGNIATAFCCHAPPLDVHTRGLLLVNSFTFICAQLAQFFHDCLKVFTCTPESRPDLPVYFHTRFLFSSSYLARVSTPLALNLYTAVTNLITLEGRKALCHGALAHQDLRSELGRLKVPCFSVCSAQNALVDTGNQVQSIIDACAMELVDSVGKVLRHNPRSKRKVSCVLWLASGHEVFQECKQDMLLLVEQLVTGFHEVHDLPHGKTMASLALASPEKPKKQPSTVNPVATRSNAREEDEVARPKPTTTRGSFEDSFMDRVLSTVTQVVPSSRPGTANHPASRGTNQLVSLEKTKWQQFQQETAQQTKSAKPSALGVLQKPNVKEPTVNNQTSPSKLIAMTSWDPSTPAFERLSSNVIYKIGNGSKIYPENSLKDLPEVKEYMGWRVRRNQKRLQRMERQARVIQRAFRAFNARMMTIRMKRERCAIHLQRLWRAKLARKKYHGMKKEDWAIRLLQRHWRGKLGRDSFQERMRKYLAAVEIQRIIRGGLARRHVHCVRVRIHNAAVEIQRLMRRFIAMRRMFKQRQRRNAAVTIQRVFRGCVGRRRFTSERDKFLFSRTQSQGIAFGKQMLLEYKLYGTKLQSEVALLAKAKTEVEVDAEALVKEICEFEEGIQLLEREMHALSQIETESMAKNVDEQGKWQLREQKMRLDREFTQMLAQIAVRKEKLSVLEEKLQQLDKERLNKEEELKGLERKLVVLLDEQQQELNKIKQKQQTRSQIMLDFMPPAQSGSIALPSGASSPGFGSPWTGSAPTPSYGAPTQLASASAFTPQQREEANALMESTETMMKFGFMSMSMTYFSSMNMVRAMRKIGAHHMTLDSAAVVSNLRWPENSASGGTPGTGLASVMPGASSPVGFLPSIPKGSFAGQQPIQVAGWSVADVGRWLDTLALGQYKRAFSDAAVDGALLLHLNDEDLKNTLGMEHKLHRKKILTSVEQLRESERVQMKRLYGSNGPDALPTGGGSSSIPLRGTSPERSAPLPGAPFSAAAYPIATVAPSVAAESMNISSVAGANLPVVVPFTDFCMLVRHGKLKQLKEALANVPDRRFDSLTVMQPFSPGVGTVYDDLLEKSAFHINKGDDKGNSPLLLAAQNNQLKVAQLLITKGANPNHQNAHGNTAGHYAMAYSFFDLGAWLLDPDKGGGRDDLVNENGLTAYDGLA